MAALVLGLLAAPSSARASTVTAATPANSAPYAYLLDYYTGKCLEVPGFSTAAGTQLDEWTCNGGSNQLFRHYSLGNGNYLFINEHSGQCINVGQNSTSNGAHIIQWPCSPSSYAKNDEWYANILATNSGGYSYYEWANTSTNGCLNIPGYNTANGTKIIQYSCIPTASNEWFASPYGP
jgi:Ricin-type beta-trefoil lectin domain-like